MASVDIKDIENKNTLQ